MANVFKRKIEKQETAFKDEMSVVKRNFRVVK